MRRSKKLHMNFSFDVYKIIEELVIKYYNFDFFTASSPGKCWFPSWLTGKPSQIWHTLDNTRTYTFHSINKTLHMSKPRNLENPEFLDLSEQKEHDTKILCNNVKFHDIEQNIFMIVAHHTTGW